MAWSGPHLYSIWTGHFSIFSLISQRLIHGSLSKTGIWRGTGFYECVQFGANPNKSLDLVNLNKTIVVESCIEKVLKRLVYICQHILQHPLSRKPFGVSAHGGIRGTRGERAPLSLSPSKKGALSYSLWPGKQDSQWILTKTSQCSSSLTPSTPGSHNTGEKPSPTADTAEPKRETVDGDSLMLISAEVEFVSLWCWNFFVFYEACWRFCCREPAAVMWFCCVIKVWRPEEINRCRG